VSELEALGKIEDGANAHVTPVGWPEHDKLIVLLNPPDPLASIVNEVEPPRITVAAGADNPREKSVPAAALGTSVANNPRVCVLHPVVK